MRKRFGHPLPHTTYRSAEAGFLTEDAAGLDAAGHREAQRFARARPWSLAWPSTSPRGRESRATGMQSMSQHATLFRLDRPVPRADER